MYTIYGDVLLCVNYIIDLAVLALTARLSGVPQRRGRRALGAFMGALCSFAIFLPWRGVFIDLTVRAAATLLMVLPAYPHTPWRLRMRLMAIAMTVGAALAGLALALAAIMPVRMAYNNGGLYLDIKPLTLAVSISAAYLLLLAAERLFAGRGHRRLRRLTITRDGRQARMLALEDTGNGLIEPFSGLPTVVAGVSELSPLLSGAELVAVLTGELPRGFRQVACATAAGNATLQAFKPDRITAEVHGRERELSAYVAVSPRGFSDGEYGAVYHPRLTQIYE